MELKFLKKAVRGLVVVVMLVVGGSVWGQTYNITSTSQTTWTVPNNVKLIKVEVIGGGGGGEHGTNTVGGGGGGGGGAYASSIMCVHSGDVIPIKIGTGGSGGSGTNHGGDTWFQSSMILMAQGGRGAANDTYSGANGGLANNSIGDVVYSGGKGGNGMYQSGSICGDEAAGGGGGGAAHAGGNGGNGGNGTAITGTGFCSGNGSWPGDGGNSSGGGNGGRGGKRNENGQNGFNYGGGGGGEANTSGTSRNGGNGAQGIIRITVLSSGFGYDEACYCVPHASNSSRYINDFITTNGLQNISNTNTGFSEGGYGYFTNHIVEQYSGENVDFSTNIMGGTAGFRIWVDWNNDGTFSTSEVVYSSSGYASSHSGSFPIDPAMPSGYYRMRIASHWLSTTGDVDPCAKDFIYGEFEDYTLKVFYVENVDAAEACGTIYVDGTAGNDANPGTATEPVKSIERAVFIYNDESSRKHFKLANGNYTYNQIFDLEDNMVIEGRYVNNGGVWEKTSDTGIETNITLSGYQNNVGGNGDIGHIMGFKSDGANNWKLIDLNIKTTNASNTNSYRTSVGNGWSNYAVWINNSTNYEISRCNIQSGNASSGRNGVNGGNGGKAPNYNTTNGATKGGAGGCGAGNSNGGSGGNGGNGGAAGIGGGGAPNGLVGSKGGYGGGGGHDYSSCPSGRTTTPNQSASNSCGAKGQTGGGSYGGVGGNGNTKSSTNKCNTGGNGYPGSNATNNGSNGLNGSNGIASFGSFYTPGKGTNGTGGIGGSGGGGGGGGAEDESGIQVAGDGGDGGGGGGGGGGAGSGGGGGGSSFVVFESGVSSGTISFTILASGVAGEKGTGGAGGAGGDGGTGGPGSHCGCGDGNNGGKGGNGSKGGNGGNGGEGSSGVSVHYVKSGVVLSSPSVTTIPNSPIVSIKEMPTQICQNSVLQIEKSTGSWTLPSGFNYVKYENETDASQYNNSSISAEITTESGLGFYNLQADATIFRSYIYVEEDRDKPVITATPSTICDGAPVTLSASSWGMQLEYKWEIYEGTTAPIKGAAVTPVASGNTATFTTSALTANADGTTKEYIVRYQVKERCCGWSVPVFKIITVDPEITPALVIDKDLDGGICIGTPVEFFVDETTNAGTNPSYEWKVNGVSVGVGPSFESNSLTNDDVVTSELTNTTGVCLSSSTVASNSIVMDIPVPGNQLSNNGESASCYVRGTTPVHFYHEGNGDGYIASVNANGDDLGLVTITSFVGTPGMMEDCQSPNNANFHTAYMGRRWIMTSAEYPNSADFANDVTIELPYKDTEVEALSIAAHDYTPNNPYDDFSNYPVVDYSEIMLTKISNGVYDANATQADCIGTRLGFYPITFGGNPRGIEHTRSSTFNVGQFSENFLHRTRNDINSPLPIELLSFSANCESTQTRISWSTATETNNDYFVLERSLDGNAWETIYQVNGAGNSIQISNYDYLDASVKNRTVYYRLTQVDFDGQTETFPVISVNCATEDAVTLHPNPTSEKVTVSVYLAQSMGESTIAITDNNGKIVHRDEVMLSAGKTEVVVPVHHFAPGVYMVRVYNDGKVMEVEKLVVR